MIRPSTARITSMAREKSPLSDVPSAPIASDACLSTRLAAARSPSRTAAGLIALILAGGIDSLNSSRSSKTCGVFTDADSRPPAHHAKIVPNVDQPAGPFKLHCCFAVNAPLWPADSGSVFEYVDVAPAREVELGARRKKVEAGLGKRRAMLARQHRIERVLQPMQVGNVIGGVGKLFFAQLRRSPIRALLFLGEIDSQQFPHQILETMLVGI